MIKLFLYHKQDPEIFQSLEQLVKRYILNIRRGSPVYRDAIYRPSAKPVETITGNSEEINGFEH